MKILVFLILSFISTKTISQIDEISNLENIRSELLEEVNKLNDSIKKIEAKINHLESENIITKISDSSLVGILTRDTKLIDTPFVLGKTLADLKEDQEIIIVDYVDNYFGICADSICGFVSEMFIKPEKKINEFKYIKKGEQDKLKLIEEQKLLKKKEEEWVIIEKGYIKKYGAKTYNRLKEGYYWIGMSSEMAVISLGSPNDINKTVGRWGVHEQWVYDNIYLYFENGKLTSYQN